MIKLRLKFDNKESATEYQIQDGELLKNAIERITSEVPLGEKKQAEVFSSVVNGVFVESDFWEFTKLKQTDTVVIAPNIQGGDSGQLFKQVAVIVIVAVASYFLTPAGGATIGSALEVAAVTIGSVLLMNALIPPPVPPTDGLNFGGNSFESSQMYSLNGQSNQVKRFASVPRVYGQFRMFPNVVGSPYIQLEVDKDTGDPVQYLYAIYDFGFGPARVFDLNIGDTPLTTDNFTDFQYNFVDPNKPAVSEGVWDDATQSSFTIYKGDNEGTNLAIGLDGNKEISGDDISTWQAIQDSAANPENVGQEIILTFVNQRGLFSFSSDGRTGYRQIDLDISYRKVGTTDWRKYNDSNYSSHWDSAGGDSSLFELDVKLADTYVSSTSPPTGDAFYSVDSGMHLSGGDFFYRRSFLKAATQIVIVDEGFDIFPGQPVMLNNRTFIGNIISVEDYIPNPAFLIINLDRPIGVATVVFDYQSQSSGAYHPVNPAGVFCRLSNATPGRARIKRSEQTQVFSSFRFTPKETGQFEVRIQRLNTRTRFTTSVQDALTWSFLATRFDRSPINTTKRHMFMELRVKATSQLNGTISNLSGVVQSVLDVYDSGTETWSKQETSNPAWVAVDLLIGEVNKRAISKDRLHLDTITEWAEFCDEVPISPPGHTYTLPRFSCNFVFDYASTLAQLFAQVASAAQASLNIVDGKYGVLIDKDRTTPVQIFTPRNSKKFSSSRLYSAQPQALNINWIDPNSAWQTIQTTIYDDGFDITNTEQDKIDELTTFACTNDEQAFRFGRYNLAQNRLRQETMTIEVDFEYLVCTRGDYVQISQDVMRVGGTPARVKTVDLDNRIITIDDILDIIPATSYGYAYRASDGTIRTDSIDTITDGSTFILPIPAIIPHVGDLIVIGEMGTIVFDCLVKAISPNDDMSATLTLIEKASGVYAAESSGTIPAYDPQISRTTDPNIQPPNAVENLAVTANTWRCAPSGYEYYVDLSWTEPPGSIYEFFMVYADSGKGFAEAGKTTNGLFEYIVDPARLDMVHTFKVLAVAATGLKLPLGSATGVVATPATKTSAPSDVEKLSTDITNQVIQLSWTAISDCDVFQYLIRFSPSTTATWESSVPLLATNGDTTLASTQARKGTYLIKAIDFNGNQSVNAAAAITTIPDLIDLNIIETIDESPDFDGSYDRVIKIVDSIHLDEMVSGDFATLQYYPEGFYSYSQLLDLGDIYTVRLQSLIQAEGFTEQDLMVNWATLDSVLQLATAQHSDWSIETQYRSTDHLNVMADWDTLDAIVTIDAGLEDNFTDWRTFFIGDATGRVFQFRLRLISNKPNVTPRVFDGTVKADMPDRFESYQNQTVDAVNGLEITYDVAFAGPGSSPNVQVSIDGASAGDYWSFDSKTLNGFLIRTFDKDDNPVERIVDIMVKGYGRKYTAVI